MNESWTASAVITADQVAYWVPTWSSARDFSSPWDSGTDEDYHSPGSAETGENETER